MASIGIPMYHLSKPHFPVIVAVLPGGLSFPEVLHIGPADLRKFAALQSN